VLAASITLGQGPAQLGSVDDAYLIHVKLSVSITDGTEYYLRGVFYQPGTSNYCGSTWNGTSWFNGPYSSGEGWKNFLKATISNNSWEGDLQAKLDTSDTGCQASGTYNFKVERFTSSGSGNFDAQTEQSVAIIVPTFTPTPTPTPKPEPTHTPTFTPKPT